MEQVQALERVGGAVDSLPGGVGEKLAELVEAIPPDVPPELAALLACAAVLPERPRLGPGMRGLARGLIGAWKGSAGEIRDDEEVLQGLWEALEFAVFALAGRGFREWAAYRRAAEEAERRMADDARAAQNYGWACKRGLNRFFDRLFREVGPGA
jgi:hypothetical protein